MDFIGEYNWGELPVLNLVTMSQDIAYLFVIIDCLLLLMATFGEYNPTVVTRDSPCWIPGTGPMIFGTTVAIT